MFDHQLEIMNGFYRKKSSLNLIDRSFVDLFFLRSVIFVSRYVYLLIYLEKV